MTVRKKTSVKKSAQRTAKKSIKKATKKSSATGRDKTELKDFKLGEKTEYSMSYAPEVLEAFDKKTQEVMLGLVLFVVNSQPLL